MNMRPWLAAAVLAALAGCSTLQPPLPDHPDAVAAIEAYYRAHAWEEGARCISPSMQVTQADVLEDTPDRLVVQTRYYWRDGKRSSKAAGFCSGFSSRTFTLEGGRVVGMTGEQRH
ncbi:MAG TPA: hypothetical protein VNS22_27265 [Geminicoccus sp.]|uniref:hypothetical protein n=1 Tax=Geminicoccus sp. TaxID=2024832 RepID=UPI002D0BAF0D|nr:hypothetical protein [Geminicoccus sp.]HWL72059.1 hypothetical protein [Geminicoccus sp.]